VPSAAGSDDEKTTFTVALDGEVDSFSPFLGIVAASYEMWALTYDYMISWSMEDMSPQPGLAEKWTTSEDGLTWTFDIRTGVEWSDGQPLTAADIAYTYNRVLTGDVEGGTWASYLVGVKKVTAPDATHVVLKLDKPNAVLPLLPIPIVPQHIWKDVDEKKVKTYAAEPKNGEPVVGSGPFRLVEGTANGSTYRFEANPDYWKGAPHVDEVVFKVYKSMDPAIQALKKGEVDFVEGIKPLQVETLKGEPGITAHLGDSPGFDEIAFNTGSVDTETGKPIGDPNPVLFDPKFRHALGYAINNEVLVDKVYQGGGEPAQVVVPPAYKDFRWTPPADQAFTFDLEKAGQLLDDAGYKLGDDGKRTMPDGSPIGELRIAARTDGTYSVGVVNYVKEWFEELGLEIKVDPYNENRLTEVILEGNYDMFEWGWYVEPDPDSILSYFTCDQRGSWSDSWYCNKEYDALYAQQHGEMDLEKRQEIIKQMQQIIFEDSPYLLTSYQTIGEAVRSDKFACLEPQPNPGGIWLEQYGSQNYLNVRPASEADQCDVEGNEVEATEASTDGGVGTGFFVGAGVVVVALLGIGGVVMMRRRSSVGERE
jgi:peptide/nickel transport system substrate-binding protein